MSRLDILKSSLKKKEAKFDTMFESYVEDVKSANGQPLNDKRNGAATMNRWNKKDLALSKQNDEIQKTKEALSKEENKIKNIYTFKDSMPQCIVDLIDKGILKQWGKYPHILFVDGVDKARIIYDQKKRIVAHKFVSDITDKEQRSKFAKVYNELYQTLNKK